MYPKTLVFGYISLFIWDYNMIAGEVLDKPESVSLTNVSVDLRGFNGIVKMYAK
jgi:hypothetical protein